MKLKVNSSKCTECHSYHMSVTCLLHVCVCMCVCVCVCVCYACEIVVLCLLPRIYICRSVLSCFSRTMLMLLQGIKIGYPHSTWLLTITNWNVLVCVCVCVCIRACVRACVCVCVLIFSFCHSMLILKKL